LIEQLRIGCLRTTAPLGLHGFGRTLGPQRIRRDHADKIAVMHHGHAR
jgi:hypothetical protein